MNTDLRILSRTNQNRFSYFYREYIFGIFEVKNSWSSWSHSWSFRNHIRLKWAFAHCMMFIVYLHCLVLLRKTNYQRSQSNDQILHSRTELQTTDLGQYLAPFVLLEERETSTPYFWRVVNLVGSDTRKLFGLWVATFRNCCKSPHSWSSSARENFIACTIQEDKSSSWG